MSLVSVLKEMGKKAGDSCKCGCVTPWFSISMGAVSSPCFPQSLCMVPNAFPSSHLALLPISWAFARIGRKGSLGLLPHKRIGSLGRRRLKGRAASGHCVCCLGSHLACFCPAFTSLQVLELRRPMDSRLEHVDFECLFTCLSVRQLIRIFASLLLERRVIFVADKLR